MHKTPNMPEQKPEPFRIGLCLAGAISAGAYTAGVMDYLLEALEEWERRKKEDPDNTPSHQVQIPVIGGASAGGMTGILTAAALHGPIPPIRFTQSFDVMAKRPGNKLYHTWVDLVADDMFPILLETTDIKEHNTRSLLNSEFIDRIAEETVKVDNPWTKRPYICDRLKLFTTLTNLEGLSFNIAFNSTSSSTADYHIHAHNDYACFELNIGEAEYGGHGWIPLKFPECLNTGLARDAAMATGAFPLGLRARRVERKTLYMNDLGWLKRITRLNPVMRDPYRTINVDGGMIDNEPFERVRDVLNEITKEGKLLEDGRTLDHDSYARTRSSVLMIDPFPSKLEEFEDGDLIGKVIGNTLGAMMSQLRTKPDILADAMHSDKAGQYIIAPSRKLKLPGKEEMELFGADAIACGTLGGFGGFLHKEFRVHDFLLGRANCEKFLRDQFTMRESAKNPIIEAGYARVIDRSKFRSETDKENGLQIIPIFPDRGNHLPMPVFMHGRNWPTRKAAEIDRLRKPIKKRVEALVDDQVNTNWFQGVLLWIGQKILISGKLADAVLNNIRKSLRKSHLLD